MHLGSNPASVTYIPVVPLGKSGLLWILISFFPPPKDFIYLFLERGEGREKEEKRNINVWFLLAHPLLRAWPATQPSALTGNGTSNPLVCRLALNPQTHTSQGGPQFLFLQKPQPAAQGLWEDKIGLA